MSPNEADVSKSVTEHLERTISNDAVLKVAEHADLEAIEETTPGRFVWLCACATAIGGMLFGYDVRSPSVYSLACYMAPSKSPQRYWG